MLDLLKIQGLGPKTIALIWSAYQVSDLEGVAKLAREAEICYATLAMVTDYDCWHPEHDSVTVEQVMAVLGANTAMAQLVLKNAVGRIGTGGSE